MKQFLKEVIKDSKVILISGLVGFIAIQFVNTPYDYLIAGVWLGFITGLEFKNNK